METKLAIEEKWTPTKLWILVGSFVALFFAISGESLWIDEANTAWKATQPDLKSWWRELVAESGSDLQMPLYMFYIWCFAKIYGASEFALRLANLPWLFLGLIVWLKAFSRQKNLRVGMAVATSSSAFVWYYLNEARPYAMQLGASFLIFGSLVRLFSAPPLSRTVQSQWSIALAVGIIFLSGSSMLGIIWVGAALLGAAVVGGKERTFKLLRESWFLWLMTLLVLLGLGAFFVWTLKSGARASGVASTGIKNVVFVFYELLGFAGLGPGRLEIRESGLSVFRRFTPVLLVYGISAVALLGAAWKVRDKIASRKIFFWPTILLSAAAGFLFIVGYATHFRVLARHFTPLAAAILFLLGLGLTSGWLHLGLKGRTLAGIFVGLSLVSCWSLRFASRHQKDDYRAAAALANVEMAGGKSVCWNADRAGAHYYRVPISKEPLPGKAWVLMNPSEDAFSLTLPDVVIASKPDVYDARYTLRKYLETKNYLRRTNFPAFTVWDRPLN